MTSVTGEATLERRAVVLVVEDDDALREFLRLALSEEFEVVDAVSGEAAIELARRAVPDVVVLDVMLPGASGLEIVRQMRLDPQLKDVPVLVMTAFSEIEPAEAEAAGASDFLAKPFDVRELTVAVKELL